jgi:hypothetical protein
VDELTARPVLRADARRNRARVLAAAEVSFAAEGEVVGHAGPLAVVDQVLREARQAEFLRVVVVESAERQGDESDQSAIPAARQDGKAASRARARQ